MGKTIRLRWQVDVQLNIGTILPWQEARSVQAGCHSHGSFGFRCFWLNGLSQGGECVYFLSYPHLLLGEQLSVAEVIEAVVSQGVEVKL